MDLLRKFFDGLIPLETGFQIDQVDIDEAVYGRVNYFEAHYEIVEASDNKKSAHGESSQRRDCFKRVCHDWLLNVRKK